MSRKIAPRCQSLLKTCSAHAITDELRALLAVARAADRFFWHSVQNEPCCFSDSCGEGARFRRAMARLDKASATPRGDR